MSAPRFFKYFAFISYSRKDEAFAKRLQHFLMGFKLPGKLRKKYPDKPKHLRPIYRDKTNMGIHKLDEAIIQGLKLSRNLIVICSQNSANNNKNGKNWVDEEVRNFLKIAPENKHCVIPVLLRKKGGPSTKECTPPAVLELGLLAADVSDKGEKRVFSDVAAKILGLDPDELWDWWERSQKFRRRWKWTFRIIGAFMVTLFGGCMWYFSTFHYSYFTDYVERNNIPEGIHEISEDEAKHLHSHYRITSYGDSPSRIENLNAEGWPVETRELPGHEARPVSITVDYQEETLKIPSQQTYFNIAGIPEQKRRFAEKSITFRATNTLGANKSAGISDSTSIYAQFEAYLSPSTRFNNQNVERFQVERDKHGFISKELYRNVHNTKPVRNNDGAWGCLYKRDNKGRPLVITYTDYKGTPLPNRFGIGSIRYKYNPTAGQVQRITYHDTQGALMSGPNGYAEARYKWKSGNLQEVAFYDAEKRPCLNNEGYAGYRSTHDQNGHEISRMFFDVEGHSCPGSDGVAEIRRTYDEHGHRSSESYYDTANRLCLNPKGYAILRTDYDERGNPVSESYYDSEDRACLSNDGIANARITYDEQNHPVCVATYDAEGHPCLNKKGIAETRFSYDKRGNITRIATYGVDGHPCICRDNFAEARITYDWQRNQTSVAYFDTQGSPCLCKEGYAKFKATYDGRGNQVSVAYFDTENNPCLGKDGIAKKHFSFDKRGNMTQIAAYGADGHPCMDNDSYAEVRVTYCAQFYDTEGRICECKDGFASVHWTYDKQGNEISRTYYDAAGRQVEPDFGGSTGNDEKEKDEKGND